MFGLFKSVVIEHAQLGSLKRSGKVWEGKITLQGGKPVALELDGTKQAPFPETIAAALELDRRMAELRTHIAPALLDHLEPYQDAMRDPAHAEEMRSHFDDPDAFDRALAISTAEQALAASTIEGVEIGMEGPVVRLLIKMSVPWDEEHLVGAYFDDWRFMELNGSV